MKEFNSFFFLFFLSLYSYSYWHEYSSYSRNNAESQCTSEASSIINGGREAYCENRYADHIWTLFLWNEDGTLPCNPPTYIDPLGYGCILANTPSSCIAAVNTTGGAWIKNGNSSSCTSGPPTNSQIASCMSVSGDNCYSTSPINSSSQCGTVNGNRLCVTSVSSSNMRSSGYPPGQPPSPNVSEVVSTPTETISTTENPTNNTKTTTRTTTTTTTTTTTKPFDQTLVEGEYEYSEGSYGEPYICQNGQYAASAVDCDTSVVCPDHQYVLAGGCFDLPEVTVVEETVETEEAVLTVDSSTGLIIDRSSTITNITSPTKPQPVHSQSPTSVTVELPDCDPEIQYCGGGFGDIDAYTADENLSYRSIFLEFSDSIQNTAIALSITSFFSYSEKGSCPVWSATIPLGITSFDFTFDQFCSDAIPWNIVYGVVIAVSLLVGGRIALT